MQVPRKLLKDYAIVQGETSVSQAALPPGYSSTVVQTFSMQDRGQSAPTAYEHMAVQQACHRILSNVSLINNFGQL